MSASLSDPSRFAQVYEAHAGAVYGAALRILGDPARAQDVAQDVFLRLWRRPGSFDARRGDLGPYLRLMARSRALDVWREGQAAGRMGDRLQQAVGGAEAPVADAPAPAVERDEARASARRAVATLPDPQREAIVLAYWGGLTAAEIARRCQVPLGTAKSRLRLGLERLRREFPELALV
jgi:RNA polymerase sigma-70 factor (ECF subfamily)